MRMHLLELMQDRDNRPALAVPLQHQRQEIAGRALVERREGLIKQQHPGILHHQPGEQHPLELSSRKRTDRALGKMLEPDRFQRRSNALPVGAARPAERADLIPQAKRHHVAHRDREGAIDVGELWQIADVALRQSMKRDAAGIRLEDSDDRLEQRAFAGAVRPDNGGHAALREAAVEMVNRRLAIEGHREVAEHDPGRNERSGDRLVHASAHHTATHRAPSGTATSASRCNAPPEQGRDFGQFRHETLMKCYNITCQGRSCPVAG